MVYIKKDIIMNNCEYVRDYYNVPACIGRIISYNGRLGIISKDRGNYIGVTFNDEKATIVHSIHPLDDKLEYLGIGKLRKLTSGQKRYAEFKAADWFDGSFAEWLGVDKKTMYYKRHYKLGYFQL